MRFTIPTIRPRNPLVAAAMRRLAGLHRKGEAACRQDHARAIQRELNAMKHIP